MLVVGNPANTNCLIAQRNAPALNPRNFTAMTRLDHNRALAQLAAKTGAGVADIAGLAIWGNHSPTMYPDLHHATVGGAPALDLVDMAWVENDFMPTVQKARRRHHRRPRRLKRRLRPPTPPSTTSATGRPDRPAW